MEIPHTCGHCGQTYVTNYELGQLAGCRCARARLAEALSTYRRTGYATARDYVIRCAEAAGLTLAEALAL